MKTIHPVTNDPLWINDLTERDSDLRMVKEFLDTYSNDNFTLSIFDGLTSDTVEITCEPEDRMTVIKIVSDLEHSFIDFIATNSLTNSYVVGMKFTRGTLDYDFYTYNKEKQIIEKQNPEE